eukprot:6213902-Pyramimonas_sp.AAC.1
MAIRPQHTPEQQSLLVGHRAAEPSPGLTLNQPPPPAGAPPPATASRAVSRSPRGAAGGERANVATEAAATAASEAEEVG